MSAEPMVKAPTPEEDQRRLGREGNILITERVQHINRVNHAYSSGFSILLEPSCPRPLKPFRYVLQQDSCDTRSENC